MPIKFNLLLLFFSSSLVFPMEYKISLEKSTLTAINWLAVLPAEMQCEILKHVLNRENDEELIERTNDLQQGDYSKPVTYNNLQAHITIRFPLFSLSNIEYLMVKNLITNTEKEVYRRSKQKNWLFTDENIKWLFSFSPDCSKLLSASEDDLLLFDIHADCKLLTSQPSIIKEKSSQYIAVSNDGNLMAELAPFKKCCREGDFYLLKIKKIQEDKPFFEATRKLQFVESIAFNKQATKVIVHAKKCNECDTNADAKNDYEIICFDQDLEKELSSKTLIDYFYQKRICKDLGKQYIQQS